MTILHIDTTTEICSVALSHRGECLFEISDNEGMNHARLLSPFIDKALNHAREKGIKLNAVAVSSGPGSYTGLRIGVSTAKGLCYGYDIPLIAVPTLEILATAAIKKLNVSDQNATLHPMIDARRMEVYTSTYNSSLKRSVEVSAEIVTEDSFAKSLSAGPCYFIGNGADKCKKVLTHPNALFPEGIELHAKYMIAAAEEKYNEQDFEDIAYFEPFYLKEFMATIPKKLL